jgi:hypothetical protein
LWTEEQAARGREVLAEAIAADQGHYQVDGDEFGYPGVQLDVIGGTVCEPGGPWFGAICEIDTQGLRRFTWGNGLFPRWIAVGNGEVAFSTPWRRGRFPLASIVDVERKRDRPTEWLTRGAGTEAWYVFALAEQVRVRYLGLFSRRKEHVGLFAGGALATIGGMARDLYTHDTFESLVGKEPFREIIRTARERRTTLREAAASCGIPRDLYDAVIAYEQAPYDLPRSTSNQLYDDLQERLDALPQRPGTQAGRK